CALHGNRRQSGALRPVAAARLCYNVGGRHIMLRKTHQQRPTLHTDAGIAMHMKGHAIKSDGINKYKGLQTMSISVSPHSIHKKIPASAHTAGIQSDGLRVFRLSYAAQDASSNDAIRNQDRPAPHTDTRQWHRTPSFSLTDLRSWPQSQNRWRPQ